MEKFDVVVVGAGPAGSCAARYAAKEGASVLLLEKRRQIGVPVQCGEFLPSVDELKNIFPNAPGIDKLFLIDESLIQKNTRRIVLISPRGREYSINLDGITVNRDEFDRYLASLAVKEGATLKIEVKFIGLSGKTVKTTAGEFESNVIIAADGPFSNVCKCASLPPVRELSLAVTCQVQGDFDDIDEVRMYFGKQVAPGGYAWIIPKKGSANVGLGIQNSEQPLNRLLKLFLEEHGFETKRINFGVIPISGPIEKTVEGNVLAVGDAAGHVMASNGGGVPVAMVCGRLAGIAAGRYVTMNANLMNYEREWRFAVCSELDTAFRTKRLADRAFKFDFTLEFAMETLGAKRLERAIRCRRVFRG
jgi:digeranylgeranylglycerophospholipid reductase